jgi:HEAT repeat protein
MFKEGAMFESLLAAKKEPAPDPAVIERLVDDLCGGDKGACEAARVALIGVGAPAVVALTALLHDTDEHKRWEAARVLSKIGNPAAAHELVRSLLDNNSGIRWLAAQGLIAAGRPGLPALLEALIQHSESVWLREGAHHILRALVSRAPADPIAPVLAALEGVEPDLTVPIAAHKALHGVAEPGNEAQAKQP